MDEQKREDLEAAEQDSQESRRHLLGGAAAALGAVAVGLVAGAASPQADAFPIGTRSAPSVRVEESEDGVAVTIESQELSRLLVARGLRPATLRDQACKMIIIVNS